MVLTKDEFLKATENEVQILLHLVSKVDPSKLDYRPTEKQRSTLEVLQYLAMFGPVHCRGALAPTFDREAWEKEWAAEDARVKAMDLEQLKATIAQHQAVYEELLASCSDEYLRTDLELFGGKGSHGMWLVKLVLSHYAAYRMQLFLYLKSSGREELSTVNLWVGRDTF